MKKSIKANSLLDKILNALEVNKSLSRLISAQCSRVVINTIQYSTLLFTCDRNSLG